MSDIQTVRDTQISEEENDNLQDYNVHLKNVGLTKHITRTKTGIENSGKYFAFSFYLQKPHLIPNYYPENF